MEKRGGNYNNSDRELYLARYGCSGVNDAEAIEAKKAGRTVKPPEDNDPFAETRELQKDMIRRLGAFKSLVLTTNSFQNQIDASENGVVTYNWQDVDGQMQTASVTQGFVDGMTNLVQRMRVQLVREGFEPQINRFYEAINFVKQNSQAIEGGD